MSQEASREEALEMFESRGEYGLLPDTARNQAYELLETNENINEDILEYSFEKAAEYWKEYAEERGKIVPGPRGLSLNVPDGFDGRYQAKLTTDIYRHYRETLELDDAVELAQELTELPDGRFENVPWDRDPRWEPEDKDQPSMFQ